MSIVDMNIIDMKLCFWCDKMVDREEFDTHIRHTGHTEVRSLTTFSGHLKLRQENARRIREGYNYVRNV